VINIVIYEKIRTLSTCQLKYTTPNLTGWDVPRWQSVKQVHECEKSSQKRIQRKASSRVWKIKPEKNPKNKYRADTHRGGKA